MVKDYTPGWLLAVYAILLIAGLVYFLWENEACSARGGVLVEGFPIYECVEPRP